MKPDETVANSYHLRSCAAMADGSVKCWSRPFSNGMFYTANRFKFKFTNHDLRLNPTNGIDTPPATIPGFSDVVDLKLGFGNDNICALISDGRVMCRVAMNLASWVTAQRQIHQHRYMFLALTTQLISVFQWSERVCRLS